MTEGHGGVLLREVFKGEGGHCCGRAESEFEGGIITKFKVIEIEAALFAASEDGDYAGCGSVGEEGEEIVHNTETTVIVQCGEDLDSLGSF